MAMNPPEAGNISRHLGVRFGSIHANECSFHEKVIKHHYLPVSSPTRLGTYMAVVIVFVRQIKTLNYIKKEYIL